MAARRSGRRKHWTRSRTPCRPPPIQFFSDQFLFLLNDSLAGKAYETWSSVSGGQSASLPPERFHFFVMGDEIQQV